MLEVGSIVDGKFRIERILGEGGMGVVAVATHLQLEQLVALKVLRDPMIGDPEVVARFMREARASARLRSEHVCKVSDVGLLEDGAPYLVMELLEGSDLQGVIAGGTLPIAVAADYVLQACVAIAEAHALGIVHRDLKPANLFLTKRLDGTPLIKVLDFGIAKASSAGDFKITRTSAIMGSPGYMSPEQLRSTRDVDARSDIWALGVILYELVSGRLPFHGESITELAVKVVVDPPEPLAVDAPAFTAVVYRCLEKAVDQRYQGVAALAADLAPLAGEPAGRMATLVATLSQGRPRPETAPAPIVAGIAPTQHTAASHRAAAGTAATAAAGTAATAAAGTAATAAAGTPLLATGSVRSTTLQTAASQSSATALPAPRKRRLALVVAGAALAAVAAAAAVYATRAPHPTTAAQVVPQPADAGGLPPSDARVAITDDAEPEPDADTLTNAELRAKLHALSAKQDWYAVLEFADVDPDDPELAGLISSARQQYLAQQARAIDAQVKQGQCARARELVTAAKEVVPGDTTLEPRTRSCKAHVAAPPPAPATIEDADQALSRGEYPRALALAEQLLKAEPSNAAALNAAALAACGAKNVDKATRYAAELHGPDRAAARALCRKNNIDLAPSGLANPPGPADPTGPGDPPSATTELDDAQHAAKAGQWENALSASQAVLGRTPRNPVALAIGVTAACHLKKDKLARSFLRRLPLLRQRGLREMCADQGVFL
jgi:eukaryotic-like serine/threonine-protein kinase